MKKPIHELLGVTLEIWRPALTSVGRPRRSPPMVGPVSDSKRRAQGFHQLPWAGASLTVEVDMFAILSSIGEGEEETGSFRFVQSTYAGRTKQCQALTSATRIPELVVYNREKRRKARRTAKI